MNQKTLDEARRTRITANLTMMAILASLVVRITVSDEGVSTEVATLLVIVAHYAGTFRGMASMVIEGSR